MRSVAKIQKDGMVELLDLKFFSALLFLFITFFLFQHSLILAFLFFFIGGMLFFA